MGRDGRDARNLALVRSRMRHRSVHPAFRETWPARARPRRWSVLRLTRPPVEPGHVALVASSRARGRSWSTFESTIG